MNVLRTAHVTLSTVNHVIRYIISLQIDLNLIIHSLHFLIIKYISNFMHFKCSVINTDYCCIFEIYQPLNEKQQARNIKMFFLLENLSHNQYSMVFVQVSGLCTCKPTWQGSDCTTDVDECLTSPCMANASCTNVDGSYNCKCDLGFKNENGTCNSKFMNGTMLCTY